MGPRSGGSGSTVAAETDGNELLSGIRTYSGGCCGVPSTAGLFLLRYSTELTADSSDGTKIGLRPLGPQAVVVRR